MPDAVPLLAAFPLAHRIVGQRHVAVARQADAARLHQVFGLAVRPVADRIEDRRRREAAGSGKIQVGGDVEARLAFQQQLLDSIAVAFQAAGHLRVQRRTLGQRTQAGPETRADASAVLLPVGGGSKGEILPLLPPTLLAALGERVPPVGFIAADATAGARQDIAERSLQRHQHNRRCAEQSKRFTGALKGWLRPCPA